MFRLLHGDDKTVVVKGVDLDSEDETGIPEALDAVATSDVVVMFLGIGFDQEHEEMDRNTTLLPGLQESFSRQVIAMGKPTVIVLINGGMVSIDSLVDKVDGIVEAFYPGRRAGEAIYRSLFGLVGDDL